MKAVAGIVTYNPDLEELAVNLNAVPQLCETIIIFDNASGNRDGLKMLLRKHPRTVLLEADRNMGIAVALNRICGRAEELAATSVVLLDQDTEIQPDGFELALSHLKDATAIVAPSVVARNVDLGENPRGESRLGNIEPKVVDYCITSGSIVSLQSWRETGKYDENMFIDFVDFDFCLRIKANDRQILREPRYVIHHSIGDSRLIGPFVIYGHSAFRCYYIARDMIYYARKHRDAPSAQKVGNRGLMLTYAVVIRRAILVAIFETDKYRKVKRLISGTLAGTVATVK